MFCVDCEKDGAKSIAMRVLTGGAGVCDKHFRIRFDQPPIVSTRPAREPKEETMGRKPIMISEQTIVELQEDRKKPTQGLAYEWIGLFGHLPSFRLLT